VLFCTSKCAHCTLIFNYSKILGVIAVKTILNAILLAATLNFCIDFVGFYWLKLSKEKCAKLGSRTAFYN